MLSLDKYKGAALPIKGLEKIGDLINYDGPILSLFHDSKARRYLFYWVDSDDEGNRWLIWKVEDLDLYHYLNAQISLKDLIQCANNGYLFCVDIDDDLVYRNMSTLALEQVPIQYQPEDKSFYRLKLPEFAHQFVEEYERSDNYYRFLMREKSLVFNISPNKLSFVKAVAANDAGGFLSKLSSSINAFVEQSFWTKYRDIIKSATEFSKLLREAKAILNPRLYGLRFGSFEVMVGLDTVKKVAVDGFSDWQNALLMEYENNVVNVDYNDPSQLNKLVELYPEAAREKIYEPYIKIINNPHYDLVIKDKADKVVRKYLKVDKEKEEILVPVKKSVQEELPKGKKFISMIVEVSEEQDVSELNKKLLQEGLLFSQQLSELRMELREVVSGDIKLIFKTPITYILSLDNNKYHAFMEDLNLYIENSDKTNLVKLLSNDIISKFLASLDQPEADPIRLFFQERVDKFIKTDPADVK
jgi:hypothetical protein